MVLHYGVSGGYLCAVILCIFADEAGEKRNDVSGNRDVIYDHHAFYGFFTGLGQCDGSGADAGLGLDVSGASLADHRSDTEWDGVTDPEERYGIIAVEISGKDLYNKSNILIRNIGRKCQIMERGECPMDMDRVYQDYGGYVFKYLMSLCHDSDLAEELTQETFCRAIRSVHRFNGTCKVSTWLCQIAKHIWYQELDKRKRHMAAPLEESHISGQHSLEDDLCLKQEKMELFKRIHILNETEKEIVLLRLTGEFSFREIGEIFGKSENWARVSFYRAKQKIVGKGGRES